MVFLNDPSKNWEAHPASDAQKTSLRRYNLATEAEIRSMTKGEASVLIGKMIETRKTAATQHPATDPQINLIKRLAARLGENGGQYLKPELTKTEASEIITTLKSRGELVDPDLDEGLYVLDNEVYKIKRSNRGHLCVLKLTKLPEAQYISNGVRLYHFWSSPINLAKFSSEHRMTKEQAQKFAQDSSCCVRCGTQLDPNITNEDGSKRWIGPDCEKKMDWR